MSTTAHSLENVPVDVGEQVLEQVADNNPDHVYAAVSGGDDSITALYFATKSPHIELDGVLTLDTGIGISSTHDFVQEQCEKLGLEYIRVGDEEARFLHERYSELVKQFGFPGSAPVAHARVRQNLKDKPFSRFTKSLDGEVALISGVRRFESERRYRKLSRDGIQEVNGILWASPLVDFTDQDLTVYRDHHDIDNNPVADVLCASGECLCGAFADRHDLPLIDSMPFTNIEQKIYHLEWEVLEQAARGEVKPEYCLWAHGSLDGGEWQVRTDVQQESLFCADCEDRCPSDPYDIEAGDPLSPAERYLKNNDLEEYFQWPFFCAPCGRVVESPLRHRREVHPWGAEIGLEGAWDMRMVDVWESAKAEMILTEPNGYNTHVNHLTKDKHKAAQYKHSRHCENVALSHCTNHDHEWHPYNGGPVQQCANCFCFRLDDYTPSNPGPPVVRSMQTADSQLTPSEREAQQVHQTLREFANEVGTAPI